MFNRNGFIVQCLVRNVVAAAMIAGVVYSIHQYVL